MTATVLPQWVSPWPILGLLVVGVMLVRGPLLASPGSRWDLREFQTCVAQIR